MMMAPGGGKPRQSSNRHHYICYLVSGQLVMAYADNDQGPQTQVCVITGFFWKIRRGNCYILKNSSRMPLLLLIYLRVDNMHDRSSEVTRGTLRGAAGWVTAKVLPSRGIVPKASRPSSLTIVKSSSVYEFELIAMTMGEVSRRCLAGQDGIWAA
jgi:hypothetical protein